MTEEVIKTYEKLKDKYSLPEYKELDKEFELEDIEESSFLLREIRKRMQERVEHFAKIVEGIIHPDTGSVASLHECRAFSDKEKEDIFNLFTRMMKIDRKALLLDLMDNEKDDAEFIKSFSKEWKEIKTEVEKIIIKLGESWDMDLEREDIQGYFG